MDDNLLSRLENYLKEYYEEPFQGYYQISSGHRKEDGKNKAPAIQSEYYQLELNLPSLKKSFATKLLELIRAKAKRKSKSTKKRTLTAACSRKSGQTRTMRQAKPPSSRLLLRWNLTWTRRMTYWNAPGTAFRARRKRMLSYNFSSKTKYTICLQSRKHWNISGCPCLAGSKSA